MKMSDLELMTLKGAKVTIFDSETVGIGGAIIEGLGEVNATVISLIEGQSIIDHVKNLTEAEKSEIQPDKYYQCLEFYKPIKGVAILDNESCDKLAAYHQFKHEEMMKNAKEKAKKEEAELEAIIPGITEMRKAHGEWIRYQQDFNAMMEDEYNDGVNPPTLPTSDFKALSDKYPKAALYMRAEDYSCAANYHKSSAGDKAMAVLKNGGSIEEAKAILDNWTNDVYID